ncbi:MAG: hypothetical protein KKB70_01075 [Proteobacteria bacterium]|nr:hypothetical protein [Pseudomonadota bacterium]
MSVGSFLLTRENLELVRKKSWKFGRPLIIDQGLKYYADNPREARQIAGNLAYMGLPCRDRDLDDVLREIAAHYYEKLFVLVKTYECYWIAQNRIEIGNSLEPFREARQTGKAVFVGQSHFGATYLTASVLMANGIDVNMVGFFKPPVSHMLDKTIKTITDRYHTAKARILNLADETIDVPMEMMKCLSSKQVVSNVYDENNAFCRPQNLLGRKIMGGTGMDRILGNFTDDQVIVVTPFLIRTSDETFKYEVDRHWLSRGNIIDSFFRSLEKRVREYYAQWYFIHELHHNFVKKDETSG